MAKIPSNKTSKFPKVEYAAIPNNDYDARIVRFIGLGVQEQPEYQGQKKAPAFKCSIQFELIDTDVTGTKEEDGVVTEVKKPACQFATYYLFPGASRGKVFDLCQILEPGIEAVPDDLEWFKNKLGAVVNVKVGSYVNKKTGKTANGIDAVTPIPAKYQAGIGAARSDMVFFDPYEDNEEAFKAYSDLFPFQREMLLEAHDHEAMPYAGKEPAKRDNAEQKPSAPTASKGAAAEDDDAPF